MFDEYPDKNRMLAITKRIAKNTSSGKSMENMIFQALANEMIHRTRRLTGAAKTRELASVFINMNH